MKKRTKTGTPGRRGAGAREGERQWASERGGPIWSAKEHAKTVADAVKDAVRFATRSGHDPDAAVADVIAPHLADAFEAGIREGTSQMAALDGERLEQRLRFALEGLRGEPAPCPHCNRGSAQSGPCKVCNGTGNRRNVKDPEPL